VIDWDGPGRQPCPECARGPKDKACGVTVEHDRSGVAHCFRCGYVETRTQGTLNAGRKPIASRSQPTKHETLSEFGLALWADCLPISGDGLAYLKARACVVPPEDGDLRYHPALKHPPSGMVGPALVALVTDAVTGVPLTLHRTWVCAYGSKAAFSPPRMLLGGHRKVGGVVRLWPDEALTQGLGLAEGIETALSLAHAFAPVWACIDAGNLAGLPVLDGVESLLIAVDHDAAGFSAAEACATRWAMQGRVVSLVVPPEAKTDLNDIARAA